MAIFAYLSLFDVLFSFSFQIISDESMHACILSHVNEKFQVEVMRLAVRNVLNFASVFFFF